MRLLTSLRHGSGRYAVSLAEQGFASILNLALSLWMIRRVGAAQYGVFVLWNNVALVASSLQNALTVCHLQAMPPGQDHLPGRRAPERLLLAVNTFLLAAVALAALAASWVGHGGLLAPRAVAAFVPAFLLYQYARALAFSRGAVVWAAGTTLAVLVGAVALFAALWWQGVAPRAGVALWVLAGAYGVAGLASLLRLTPGARPLIPLAELRGYGSYVRDSLWVLLGVGSTELIARFYSFIVTAWYGPAALGTLSAAQVMLRPTILAVNAWGSVARADMAAQRAQGGWSGFLRSLGRGAAGVLAISLPWAIAVWLGWPLVSRLVFAGRFPDIGWIALLWGISAGLGGLQNALSLAFQALRAFRALAWADLAAAVATVAATPLLLRLAGYPFAVVGMMGGQGLEVALLAVLLWRRVRADPTPSGIPR